MTEVNKDTEQAAPAGDSKDQEAFSFGINEDDNTSPAAEGQSAVASPEGPPEFDPDNVDWRRVNPNTLPNQYQPLAKMAKEMQAGFTKANQELQASKQQATAERQQYLGLIEKLASPINGEADPYADIRATLDPQQQAAIDTVREVVKREMGDTATKLQEEQGVLKQGVLAIAKFLQSQQSSTINDEATALRGAYGDDIDNYVDSIRALQQIVNPKTGKAYSMTEAYENLSGAIVNKTINARKVDAEVRTTAANDSLFPPSAESVEGEAPISETQVDAALKKLGFD